MYLATIPDYSTDDEDDENDKSGSDKPKKSKKVKNEPIGSVSVFDIAARKR